MIGEIIIKILALIGGAVVLTILAILADITKRKLKEVMNRQSKIRCLCKHKFVIDYAWESVEFIDYSTKCKKCGKEKDFRIYKKEDHHE